MINTEFINPSSTQLPHLDHEETQKTYFDLIEFIRRTYEHSCGHIRRIVFHSSELVIQINGSAITKMMTFEDILDAIDGAYRQQGSPNLVSLSHESNKSPVIHNILMEWSTGEYIASYADDLIIALTVTRSTTLISNIGPRGAELHVAVVNRSLGPRVETQPGYVNILDYKVTKRGALTATQFPPHYSLLIRNRHTAHSLD